MASSILRRGCWIWLSLVMLASPMAISAWAMQVPDEAPPATTQTSQPTTQPAVEAVEPTQATTSAPTTAPADGGTSAPAEDVTPTTSAASEDESEKSPSSVGEQAKADDSTNGVKKACTSAKAEADETPPASSQATAKDKAEDEPVSSKSAEPSSSPAEATSAPAEPTSAPTTSAAAEEEEEKKPEPRVEVYIPSTFALGAAARKSDTADLVGVVSGMFGSASSQTDDELDIGAILDLLDQVRGWPDTSLAFATFTEDREGRPRWGARVDWPLDEFAERLGQLLEHEAAAKVLEKVSLHPNEDGSFRLELPDVVLAVLRSEGTGSVILSAEEVVLPDLVFGQPKPPSGDEKPRKPGMLIYSRLSLASEDVENGDSPFSQLSGVKDILYGASLKKNGQWREKFSLSWNPLLGMAIKAAVKKVDEPFECPKDAYLSAAFHVALGQGMADGLAGLEMNTIGGRAGSEAAFSVVDGTGFLPFPDLYYQFRARHPEKVRESIRSFVKERKKDRIKRELKPDWFEEKVGRRTVFWHDPAIGGAYTSMPVTYRTVIFFHEADGDGEEASEEESLDREAMLVIAQTPMWADDAVEHWDALMKFSEARRRLPSSKRAHWQGRISWRKLYDFAVPYMTVLAGLGQDSELPPRPEELKGSLADSVINVKIEYVGLTVRHTGPIPLGLFYVPGVAVASLSSTPDMSSEAARERAACKRLRVLYHHAKLFKKDYERWPATVAELDGYVDFDSHPALLRLWEKERSFVEGFVSVFTTTEEPDVSAEEDDSEIDDSLYEIDWSETDWRLKIRANEFKHYKTICIDAEGKIHRIPLDEDAASEKAEKETP